MVHRRQKESCTEPAGLHDGGAIGIVGADFYGSACLALTVRAALNFDEGLGGCAEPEPRTPPYTPPAIIS